MKYFEMTGISVRAVAAWMASVSVSATPKRASTPNTMPSRKPRMWFSAKMPMRSRRSAAFNDLFRAGILRSSQSTGYIGAARPSCG